MARHHQSKKARMHEERGEERHLRGHVKHHDPKVRHHGRMGEEHYAGSDERRRQEGIDFHMISEDRNAVANLPQHVIQHDWERPYGHYARYNLDDTMHGIDRQEDEDTGMMERHLQPGKY